MKPELEIKDKTTQSEGIKIAPFKKHIRKTSPHKHNSYFEIIYLTKGSGLHTIDTTEFKIKTPILFTIRKEQVHFWDIKTEPEGFVIIIKKSFIENCLDKEIKRIISDLSAHQCLFPKDTVADDIFNLLLKEFNEKETLKHPIIDGLLKALLGKLLESAKPTANNTTKNSTFKQFIDLLNQEKKLTNSVNYYAQLLNTSSQNLNTICRKHAGQSATEVISLHIINEAKRFLLYTDFSVNEITHKLDFKDNSHFTKYFKRHVNLTPNQFRKEQR